MRYWYRDIRWGVLFGVLGILLLLGVGLFYLFVHSPKPTLDEVSRVGVETYIGEGRKDEVIQVAEVSTQIGLGIIGDTNWLGVVEVPSHDSGTDGDAGVSSDEVIITPTEIEPEFTGGVFAQDAYHLYHGQDSLSVSFAPLSEFYILGNNVSDGNDGSFKFEESLLSYMRTSATENGITLATYGVISGPDGQVGAYIITDDSPFRAEETVNDETTFYSLSLYMWDDANVMHVSGLVTSKVLPEWLSSLHLS